MKIGLVGASYQAFSLPFDAERSINLYPVLDQQGKEVSALYSSPGLSLFSTAGTGAVRGGYLASNGRLFFISGAILYEVGVGGAVTSRGSLLQSAGNISIAENGVQLAICDGINVYILTYSNNAFARVTDSDLPSAGSVCFIDGYFVVNKNKSQAFYISALYDGTSWAALDFASAESSPDYLLRVFNALGQLWLFGSKSTELWSDTGSNIFPFQKIAGGKMEVGIHAPLSVVATQESLFWLAQDEFGINTVYRTSNVQPTQISNEAINLRLATATTPEDIVGYIYRELDHTFYVLTGGGLDTTLVYDLTTQLWHERAYLNSDGNYETHLGSCCVSAFNKVFVGSRVDGSIYEMSKDYYSDNGAPLCRERVYTHIVDENKRIRYNKLNIGFETGVGLQSGQGQDPQCTLQLSKDGARTWSTSYSTSIGKVGEYTTQVNFRRLGINQQMTFRIRVSDPVKVTICGSYLS